MELEVTWGRTVRVWWAIAWRNIIAIIVAIIISILVGFIFGFIMAMMGAEKSTIQYIGFAIGLIIGLGISLVPIKMVLGKDFGEFKLILVQKGSGTDLLSR